MHVRTLIAQNHEPSPIRKRLGFKLSTGNSELLHRLKTNRQETLEAWGALISFCRITKCVCFQSRSPKMLTFVHGLRLMEAKKKPTFSPVSTFTNGSVKATSWASLKANNVWSTYNLRTTGKYGRTSERHVCNHLLLLYPPVPMLILGLLSGGEINDIWPFFMECLFTQRATEIHTAR